MSQRALQFLQFPRWPVNFNPDQVSNLERFREHRTNVIEMDKKPLSIDIPFATKNYITIDGELIEKILLLGSRFLDETRQRRLQRFEFPRMHFEIRVKTDEVRSRAHVRTVNPAPRPVERVPFPASLVWEALRVATSQKP